MKKIINNLLRKVGYEIKKVNNGFTLNKSISWMQKLEIRTILDIGGNEGQFARFISRIFPKAKIYSFEPIRECFDKLELLRGSIPNLCNFNFALGDSNENLKLYKNDFTPSSSILPMTLKHVESFPFTSKGHLVDIEVRRLDDILGNILVEKDVLVKIDVQGYEKKVIMGGYNFLSKFPKMIFIEMSFAELYENEPSFDEIYECLIKMGYGFRGVLNQLYDPHDGTILQADGIFVKGGSIYNF